MSFAPYLRCSAWKCASALSIIAFSLSFASTAAVAANGSTSDYQKARAACMNGQTYEDRATCLKEAGAAQAEAKRGHLIEEDTAAYQKNAEARCKALPDGDRQDCLNRAHGEGVVSGSVAGGGIYRETTTIITNPQPEPSQPQSPPLAP